MSGAALPGALPDEPEDGACAQRPEGLGKCASFAAARSARASRKSAFDPAYIVTPEEVKQFRRNAMLASFGYGMAMMGNVILVVVMPFSFNYIVGGSVNSVSAESSSLLSLAVIASTSCGVLVQDFWGRGGGWFGRQKMLAAISLLGAASAVCASCGHAARIPELWIVSSVLSGLSGAAFATASSYCADMSTADNFAMITGVLSSFSAFGVVAALVVQALGGENMVVPLAISVAAFLIAFVGFALLLPDVSPPASKRETPTRCDIARTFLVCNIGSTFLAQTRFTKCLLAAIFFGSAGGGCIRVWIFGFALVRFAMTAQSIGILFVASFVFGGLVVPLGTRFLPAKLGCNILFWMNVSCPLIATFGPAKEPTLWVAMFCLVFNGLSESFLISIFMGQLSGRRRGEVAALQSLADKLGNLLGVFVVTPINVMWLESYMATGEGTQFTPPMAHAILDGLGIILYYAAQLCLRHQDKFGVFVLRTSGESPDEQEVETVEIGAKE